MKDTIAQVLLTLSKATSIDHITVKAIVEKSHISRPLFYYYYQDIFDVMAYIFEKDLQTAIDEAMAVTDIE